MRNAPSKLLAGAEACHRMIATIQGLKTIQIEPEQRLANEGGPDDGKRRDYQAADEAVNRALDDASANPGFRLALSNYLLAVHSLGAPDMDRWGVADMLSDDDYRPVDFAEKAAAAPQAADDIAAVDFEDDGFRLESLLWLAEWIERARDLASQIETVAEHSAPLRDALNSHGIPICNAQWNDEASAGLNFVTVTAINLARTLTANGMALSRQLKGANREQA
jgi:hypothetical protein